MKKSQIILHVDDLDKLLRDGLLILRYAKLDLEIDLVTCDCVKEHQNQGNDMLNALIAASTNKTVN